MKFLLFKENDNWGEFHTNLDYSLIKKAEIYYFNEYNNFPLLFISHYST